MVIAGSSRWMAGGCEVWLLAARTRDHDQQSGYPRVTMSARPFHPG